MTCSIAVQCHPRDSSPRCPLDKRLEDILRSLPSTPRPSRLLPYAELINELRARGWSYRQIAVLLAEKCDLQVSYRSVHHFVQIQDITAKADRPRRSHHAALKAEFTHERPNDPHEVSQRIATLKRRAPRPESEGLDFEFDPTDLCDWDRVNPPPSSA